MLLLGVSTMGLASGGIALLPTFATAGIWAPILLMAFRALQG
jgi:MHS family shikimate/dehydroshikimate transporter-like MFS transporter